MSASEADAFTASFRRDRELEAEIAVHDAELARLHALISKPRAGRHREQKLAEAYALVRADIGRILGRKALANIDSTALLNFLAHRVEFLK